MSPAHRSYSATYFSIGGGFIAEDGADLNATPIMSTACLPYPFQSAAELLDMAKRDNLRIDEIMMRNECARRDDDTPDCADSVRRDILRIWEVMQSCVARGLATDGILPGGLRVRRRAKRLAARLQQQEAAGKGTGDPLAPLDWVTIYAMAVNEENAAGSRVVTAPTNGAAGVIPAVATTTATTLQAQTKPASASSSPPRRSAFSTKKTPPSPAQRSAARAKSASPAPWPRAD